MSTLDKTNPALQDKLNEILKASGVSPQHQKLAVEGTIKLQASASQSMNRAHTVHSYEYVGWRVILGKDLVGPCFETILTRGIKANT